MTSLIYCLKGKIRVEIHADGTVRGISEGETLRIDHSATGDREQIVTISSLEGDAIGLMVGISEH
jgi:hypothetical protein